MAKKKESLDERLDELEQEFAVAAVAEIPPPAPKPPAPPPPPAAPVMSFDRYFALSGRPVHHKAGLQAYFKTTAGGAGKRTKSAWDVLFAQY